LDFHDDPERGIQYITLKDLEHLGMEKETVSAAMIPAGYDIFFYFEDNFLGKKEKLSGKDVDSNGFIPCQPLGDLHDKV
jgi:hypothetical protein